MRIDVEETLVSFRDSELPNPGELSQLPFRSTVSLVYWSIPRLAVLCGRSGKILRIKDAYLRFYVCFKAFDSI